MSRELSTRQRKFLQAKLAGKSNAQAARDAGYSKSVANVAGKKILSHPAVQAKLQQLMERAGLTDERLTTTIQAPNDTGRFVHLGQLDYTVRILIRSFIYSLMRGRTDAALLTLRSLQKNVHPKRAALRNDLMDPTTDATDGRKG